MIRQHCSSLRMAYYFSKTVRYQAGLTHLGLYIYMPIFGMTIFKGFASAQLELYLLYSLEYDMIIKSRGYIYNFFRIEKYLKKQAILHAVLPEHK